MLRISQLSLSLDYTDTDLARAVCRRLRIEPDELGTTTVWKRAVDARDKRKPRFMVTVDVNVDDTLAQTLLDRAKAGRLRHVTESPGTVYPLVEQPSQSTTASGRPVIVGSGPCGLFAALLLCYMGLRPIVLERGKKAGDRARDVTRFWRTGEDFDPESNVQFGEGGAGTFSDGKLYTQISDSGNRCRWILEQLVAHGAPSDILTDSRPHVGTDKLITVLRRIRATILDRGGEIRFQNRVVDLHIEDGRLRGVVLSDGTELETDTAILAVGHSARDVFALLRAKGVAMESKAFSVGVRIEHPQKAIDRTQYGPCAGHALLGAASYKFVNHNRSGRSVYSFCMCPGGLVVGAASEPGRLVTNGMSSYARDDANANAGFMVEVGPKDFPESGPLGGIALQRALEEKAFQLGGGNYRAPAQLLGDFLAGRPSRELGEVKPSFRPGVRLCDLRDCLPEQVVQALRQAAPRIDRRLPGFNRPDAILTAVESRSSSPLRILRDRGFESVTIRGLYPAGEGAGYAGGIISAAVDGMRVAEAIGALMGKASPDAKTVSTS